MTGSCKDGSEVRKGWERHQTDTQEKRAGMSQVNSFSRTQAPVGVWRDGTMSCNSLNVKD